MALKLNNGDYDLGMKIPSSLKSEFLWWLKSTAESENSILSPNYVCHIFTDASTSGWGAFCNGKEAKGFWDLQDSGKHKLFGIKGYFLRLPLRKTLISATFSLRVDNMTAVSYINRMGCVKYFNLNTITKQIWQWCERRKIILFACYINTKSNIKADKASRSKDIETEYSLHPKTYKAIIQKFGIPEIDLFSNYQNTNSRIH